MKRCEKVKADFRHFSDESQLLMFMAGVTQKMQNWNCCPVHVLLFDAVFNLTYSKLSSCHVIYRHVTHCQLSCHYLPSSLRSLDFHLVGKHSESPVRSSCGVQATPEASLYCLMQPMDCVSRLYTLVSTCWCLWVLGSTWKYFLMLWVLFCIFKQTFWYYRSVVFKL